MTRIVRIFLAVSVVSLVLLGFAIGRMLDDANDLSANWNRFHAAINASKVRGDMIVEQLERFHTEEGRYPESLDDLVPEYLTEIPHPTDGEGFFYEPRDNGFRLKFGYWFVKDIDLYPRCCFSSSEKKWLIDE
jgi:hypothetical protein